MNLYQSIIEILHNDFQVSITSDSHILQEIKEENYPDSELKMSGRKILFQYDQDNVEIYPFFSTGFAKKCTDYILFYPHQGKLFIFIIELKSKSYKGAYKQFLATKNFVNYIVGMAASHRIAIGKISRDEKIEIRCLLLTTARLTQKPLTNPKSKLKYHRHEYGYDYTIINCGNKIYVDHLCS